MTTFRASLIQFLIVRSFSFHGVTFLRPSMNIITEAYSTSSRLSRGRSRRSMMAASYPGNRCRGTGGGCVLAAEVEILGTRE